MGTITRALLTSRKFLENYCNVINDHVENPPLVYIETMPSEFITLRLEPKENYKPSDLFNSRLSWCASLYCIFALAPVNKSLVKAAFRNTLSRITPEVINTSYIHKLPSGDILFRRRDDNNRWFIELADLRVAEICTLLVSYFDRLITADCCTSDIYEYKRILTVLPDIVWFSRNSFADMLRWHYLYATYLDYDFTNDILSKETPTYNTDSFRVFLEELDDVLIHYSYDTGYSSGFAAAIKQYIEDGKALLKENQ